MTKEEIINEGWLEAYLTGDVSETEAATIEKFLAEDQEVKMAYEEVQETLADLAFLQQIAPKPDVKQRLEASVGNQNPSNNQSSALLTYATAASVVLAMSLAFTAYFFWDKWQDAESKYATLITESQVLASNLQRTSKDLEVAAQKADIATSPNYQRVVLAGTDNAPSKQAIVFWNPEQEKVYLSTGNLGSLSTDQQYQLWALIDGQPIDAGIFNPSSGLLVMKNIKQADSFAVTVEKQGGSEQPDLSTLQVIGNAS